ncbi:hypothetical protein ACVWZK_008506 [Bradyrhizobium sp. GM0.4]
MSEPLASSHRAGRASTTRRSRLCSRTRRSINSTHSGWQDRRREPEAVGIGGVRLPISDTWLAESGRNDTGHHRALWQTIAADDALAAARLQIVTLAEKVRNRSLTPSRFNI